MSQLVTSKIKAKMKSLGYPKEEINEFQNILESVRHTYFTLDDLEILESTNDSAELRKEILKISNRDSWENENSFEPQHKSPIIPKLIKLFLLSVLIGIISLCKFIFCNILISRYG